MTTDLITRIAAGQGEDAEVLLAIKDARDWLDNESGDSDYGYKRQQCRALVARLDAILRTKENPDAV